jgi:hypothetical protein
MVEETLPESVSPGDLMPAALKYVGVKVSGLLSTVQFRRFMNVATIINETDERITTRRGLRIDQSAIIRQSIPHNTIM